MKENKIFASINLNDDNDTNALESLVLDYEKSGAEGICIYDKATNDKSHDDNVHFIKSLCAKLNVPVYVGNVKSLEDVKKYLYAGCEGVIISSVAGELTKEAVDRFVDKTYENDRNISSDTGNVIPWEEFKLNESGLIPCIVQDATDGCVLMMAYMNKEAYEATLNTGRMTYYSRSRNKLWIKGEESGHFQYMKNLYADCDKDTLLATVKQIGVACHTGERSCFFNKISGDDTKAKQGDVLSKVYEIIIDRKENPKEGSYTNYLFDKGIDKVLKKVGEESSEIIIAAKNPEREEIIYEIADFLYHVSVLMAMKNVTWDEIMKELLNR